MGAKKRKSLKIGEIYFLSFFSPTKSPEHKTAIKAFQKFYYN